MHLQCARYDVVLSSYFSFSKNYKNTVICNKSDGASGTMSASGAGGMGIKFRADQISHTLPTTRHRCKLDVWALAQSRGDGHHSLMTPKTILMEYNKD